MAIIESIYDTGDDSLINQFELNITPLANVIESTGLKFRVQTFSIPEDSIGTYEIKYKGETITKPNYDITTPKTFTFTIRNDKQYEIYSKFKDWIDLIKNPDTGLETTDKEDGQLPAFRTDAIVNATDVNGNVYLTHTFKGMFPTSISGIEYDNATGEPIILSITCAYLKKITA